jgi:hypothetical protein
MRRAVVSFQEGVRLGLREANRQKMGVASLNTSGVGLACLYEGH